ncbi:hypothetical protein ACP4OV_004637 [Aristida adscensionis]
MLPPTLRLLEPSPPPPQIYGGYSGMAAWQRHSPRVGVHTSIL